MKIAGLQKLSVLDYPETVAATIFTYGCNLLCPFCHNPSLVITNHSSIPAPQLIDPSEVLDYLNKRKSMLGGVCITGGEPLIQKDILSFIKEIKKLGLKVKLDTNGFLPDRLEELLKENLIDYVAMDIKNSQQKYAQTVGVPSIDVSNIYKSTQILKQSGVLYEFRTTLVKELHSPSDLECIGKWLSSDVDYYLQNFLKVDKLINDFTNIERSLSPFSILELETTKSILEKYFRSVTIRGI